MLQAQKQSAGRTRILVTRRDFDDGVEQKHSHYFLPVTVNIMAAGVMPLGVLTVVPADANDFPD